MLSARIPTLISIALLPAAVSDVSPRFTISRIATVPTASTIVGALRSGLLCTPAGRLRWRDVEPDEDHLKRSLAGVLTDLGIDTKIPSDDDFDRQVRTPYRVTVTILRADVTACIPWRGLQVAGQAKMKATTRLVTLWRVFDQKAHMLIVKVRVCVTVSNRQDSSPVEAGMVRAAADFASAYRGAEGIAGRPAPGETTGCTAAERLIPDER